MKRDGDDDDAEVLCTGLTSFESQMIVTNSSLARKNVSSETNRWIYSSFCAVQLILIGCALFFSFSSRAGFPVHVANVTFSANEQQQQYGEKEGA